MDLLGAKVMIFLLTLLTSCLIVWALHHTDEERIEPPKTQPRYHCEDNSDTTKGHYKGVLTHCEPVVIERRM